MRDISGLFRLNNAQRQLKLYWNSMTEAWLDCSVAKYRTVLETRAEPRAKHLNSKYGQERKELGPMYNLLIARYSQFPLSLSKAVLLPASCLLPPRIANSPILSVGSHLASEQSWAGNGVSLRLVRIVYDSWVSRLVCAGEGDLGARSRACSRAGNLDLVA